MKRSALCVSMALLLLLAILPGRALAETGIKIEDVYFSKSLYPPVHPSEGPLVIYAGEWALNGEVHNYDIIDSYSPSRRAVGIKVRIFLDNILLGEPYGPYFNWGFDWYNNSLGTGDSDSVRLKHIYPSGEYEVLIQVWHGTESQPQDEYSFWITVVEPKVSGLQASSKVVRALEDNSLVVSFINEGNENMRQAVLSVADPSGLELEPEEVELGDVDAGESVSTEFTVSSPADVTLGTVQVRFSLSFIDYAGVSHEKDINAEVEVYRLEPTLTLSVPGEIENGATVEIVAFLRDPDGELITGKNVTLTVGGVELGTFETGSDGAARASYTVTETGTFDVGASFSGSASYDAASDSKTLMVVPTASSPYWILPVILVALLFVVSVAYLKRRKSRSGQKTPE